MPIFTDTPREVVYTEDITLDDLEKMTELEFSKLLFFRSDISHALWFAIATVILTFVIGYKMYHKITTNSVQVTVNEAIEKIETQHQQEFRKQEKVHKVSRRVVSKTMVQEAKAAQSFDEIKRLMLKTSTEDERYVLIKRAFDLFDSLHPSESSEFKKRIYNAKTVNEMYEITYEYMILMHPDYGREALERYRQGKPLKNKITVTKVKPKGGLVHTVYKGVGKPISIAAPTIDPNNPDTWLKPFV